MDGQRAYLRCKLDYADVLLLESFSTNSQGRAMAVYDVPGRPMLLRYDLGDSRKVRAVREYAASALRITNRRFSQGFNSREAVVVSFR
jgi:hypothetical protein